MSLQDPTKKMSKSDENPNGFVTILDDRDTVIRKFRRAVTDSDACVRYAEGKDGINNLMTIYAAVTGKTLGEIETEFEGKGYLRCGTKDVSVEPYETGKYAYWIENLTPSTAYSVRLWFKTDGIDGKVDETTKFTTASAKKHVYPYIWLDSAARTADGQFVSGTKIPLRVWNATEATEVKWFFNGSSIPRGKDGWYELKRSGELSAEVIWEDGTQDVVYKKIVVK